VGKGRDLCEHDRWAAAVRHVNLCAEQLGRIGRSDPALGTDPPTLYAVTLRRRQRVRRKPLLDTWCYLRARLPTNLPLVEFSE
jgi:hypothetical protein